MNTSLLSTGPIHLMLNDSVWQALIKGSKKLQHWPSSPTNLGAQLENFVNGVPTIVEEDKRGPRMIFCTPTYRLLAGNSKRGDAFYVYRIEPLTLSTHGKLVSGALLVKPTRWQAHIDFQTIPKESRSPYRQIVRAWQDLAQAQREVTPPTYTISITQKSYLNTVSQLIDLTRRLVNDRAALEAPVGYRNVEAAGEVRMNKRDIYRFQLDSQTPKVNAGEFLRIQEKPDLRGRVSDIDGEWITLKFDTAIDRGELADQGVLERSTSDRPFRLQQDAVERLRNGEAHNSQLLSILVNHRYQPFVAPPLTDQAIVNLPQWDAWQRSLVMPDLLLVLGPPGTGKTKTITDIVESHGERRRRVLLTAKTHKAVDNVLERLPSSLMMLRIGHEDRVGENTQHLLIESQARSLQQTILTQTESYAQALDRFVAGLDIIRHRLQTLLPLTGEWTAAEKEHTELQRQRMLLQTQLLTPHVQRIAALNKTMAGQQERLEQLTAKLGRWQTQMILAKGRTHTVSLGFVYGWWQRYLNWRFTRTEQTREQLRADHNATIAEFTEARRAERRATHTPDYRQLESACVAADETRATLKTNAAEIAHELDRTIANVTPQRPSLTQLTSASLTQFCDWYQDQLPIMAARQKILADWRTGLMARTEDLYPALVRMADVVGATCIGIASDDQFNDVTFDLVIADEAGQISLPDLLVPLVRAKRALLVGDHHQLPPFVENEVQDWLRNLSPESLPTLNWIDDETDEMTALANLLTKSVFESLFPNADPTHVVRFTHQYRMPQSVSDFVANLFYQGQLFTALPDKQLGTPHSDPLFNQPIAFVDTSTRPGKERYEHTPGQSKADPEGWGMSGYVNRLEATLIADFAETYEMAGLAWVIIVPYKAQAALIRQELRKRPQLAQHSGLEEQVATVDSFQGGESDQVIYGFTRSNAKGKVGFLRELRRLNVAMTRTRKQLVLIGDKSTLCRATDSNFRTVFHGLLAHVAQQGEILSYEECRDRLSRVSP